MNEKALESLYGDQLYLNKLHWYNQTFVSTPHWRSTTVSLETNPRLIQEISLTFNLICEYHENSMLVFFSLIFEQNPLIKKSTSMIYEQFKENPPENVHTHECVWQSL